MPPAPGHAAFVYSGEQLIALMQAGMVARPADLPPDLWRKTHRGCRGGKQRRGRRLTRNVRLERRKFKPCLPSTVMGNVQSLNNKMDELTALTRSHSVYRECSLMCFTETWLNMDITDPIVSVDGFHTVRADRDCTKSGKRKGGGLAILVNIRWCNPGHICIKDQICSPDSEVLAVGLRPYHLPRGISHVIIITVYIPPTANPSAASGTIHSTISKLHVPLVKRKPVTTRTVRKWSGESFEALQYCFEVTDWPALCEPHGEDIDGLTECITDYVNFCVDCYVPASTVTCYANNKPWITKDIKAILNDKKRAFREGNQAEMRRVQGVLKVKIKEAKDRYRRKLEKKLQENNTRDVWSGMKTITGFQKTGSVGLEGGVARANEFNLFFNRFDTVAPAPPPHDPAAAAAGSPTTSATPPPPPSPPPYRPPSCLSPALFTPGHFTPSPCPTPPPCSAYCPPLPVDPIPPPPTDTTTVSFTPDLVRRQLIRLHSGKAAGPDGVFPRVLKACAPQLCGVLNHVFNLSLHLQKVPLMWKTSCLVPVPKTLRPSSPKDYRPVALTSHIMKTLERLVLDQLRPMVRPFSDQLQFAYQPSLGVEDCIIYLLNKVYSHLDKPASTVRVMFFTSPVLLTPYGRVS